MNGFKIEAGNLPRHVLPCLLDADERNPDFHQHLLPGVGREGQPCAGGLVFVAAGLLTSRLELAVEPRS